MVSGTFPGRAVLLGIAISRASALDVTWTTVHLAQAALDRGHAVRFIEPWDFEVDPKAHLTARAHAFDPPSPGAEAMVQRLRRRTATRRYVRIDQLDMLLLRAAPFNPQLLGFATMAQERGVAVVNDPAGLVRVNQKAWLAGLRDVPKPPTLVTQSLGAAQLFYQKQRSAVIVKPARGSGGHGVHLVKRRDGAAFDHAFLQARARGAHVVVQGYLKEASEGEKRVVWIDGDPVGAYLRTRAEGEFRHNLKQGGTAVACPVTEADRETIDRLSPHLMDAGIRLAGIDLIGSSVIEVNVLNPGGAYHTDRLHGTDVAGTIVERLLAGPAPQRS